MPPIRQVPRRYFIEFNTALALYIAATIGREYVAHQTGDPTLRTLILVSPILPVLLAAWAVVRFYRGIDEYHRLQILEALAIAAGATGIIAVSWGFLQDVGFPKLSLSVAWPIIALVWAAVALYLGWKDKVSEGTAWRTLGGVALTFVFVAAGTAIFAAVDYALGTPIAWSWLTLVATVLFIARMGVFIFSSKSSC